MVGICEHLKSRARAICALRLSGSVRTYTGGGEATNDGANYTGAHVVFFVGQEDMTYADSLADSALRNEAYSTWMEEAEEAASVTTSHLGMCGKNH